MIRSYSYTDQSRCLSVRTLWPKTYNKWVNNIIFAEVSWHQLLVENNKPPVATDTELDWHHDQSPVIIQTPIDGSKKSRSDFILLPIAWSVKVRSHQWLLKPVAWSVGSNKWAVTTDTDRCSNSVMTPKWPRESLLKLKTTIDNIATAPIAVCEIMW